MIPQGRVAETFFSIQGEGPTAGLPAVFIRLQGCSVGCQWCDTRYSWDPGQGDSVDVSRLLAQALGHPCRRVVITGGEPLESSLFESLLTLLCHKSLAILGSLPHARHGVSARRARPWSRYSVAIEVGT